MTTLQQRLDDAKAEVARIEAEMANDLTLATREVLAAWMGGGAVSKEFLTGGHDNDLDFCETRAVIAKYLPAPMTALAAMAKARRLLAAVRKSEGFHDTAARITAGLHDADFTLQAIADELMREAK